MPYRRFKYRLYPSKTQTKILEEQLELCRITYNLLLDYCKQQYKEKKKVPSLFDLGYLLPPLKRRRPKLSMVYAQALRNTAKRIMSAYTNFYARRRLGLKAGLPRFKKYGRYKSITYPQKGFKIEGSRLNLSKIGSIKIRIHRRIEGEIKTLTVKRMPSGKWFAYFSCRVEEQPKEKPFKEVGIDVGLNCFAMLSDGSKIENPRYYRKEEPKLARLQRQLSRKKKGSRNNNKARIKITRLHEKILNRRNDFLHKTSRWVANKYQVVYVEDLKIWNMIKNPYFSKSISDAGWGRFIEMIRYKEEESGGELIKVNPHNTTQRCSQCGKVVEKTLSDRTHICPFCGLIMDRDLNASRNILKIGRGSPEYTPVGELTSTPSLEREQVNSMSQEAQILVNG